jgi:hypothetical protein
VSDISGSGGGVGDRPAEHNRARWVHPPYAPYRQILHRHLAVQLRFRFPKGANEPCRLLIGLPPQAEMESLCKSFVSRPHFS